MEEKVDDIQHFDLNPGEIPRQFQKNFSLFHFQLSGICPKFENRNSPSLI